MQKMTIETPFVSKDGKIEMALPFFRKQSAVNGQIMEYFGAINEDTFISIYISSPRTHIGTNNRNTVGDSYILTYFSTWETIEETEFLKVHAETLKSLSLQPVLVDGNPDDITDVL